MGTFLARLWSLAFGTERRIIVTLIVMGLVVVATHPGTVERAANGLVQELMPLVGPLLGIAIVIGGFRWMVLGRPTKK